MVELLPEDPTPAWLPPRARRSGLRGTVVVGVAAMSAGAGLLVGLVVVVVGFGTVVWWWSLPSPQWCSSVPVVTWPASCPCDRGLPSC